MLRLGYVTLTGAMNVHTMQRIDYWFGIPVCLILSLVEVVCRPWKIRRPATAPIKRILCIELSEMGSAILAYPMMRKALDTYQDAECHFLIFRRNVESVEMLELLSPKHIHVIEDTNLFAFTLSALKMIIKLRRIHFDATLDLELFSRCTAIISCLVGAPIKAGFHNYTEEGLYRGTFFTHRVWYNPHYHISQNFMALLESLRADPTDVPLLKIAIKRDSLALPRLSCPNESARAAEVVRELYPDFSTPHSLILLNPDPGLLTLRGWPIQSYRQLAHRLLSENEHVLIGVVGLARGAHLHSAIASGTPNSKRCINMCGAMDTLHDLLGLFKIASVLVTNDSGPAHLAPLVDLPSVVLFGPESPNRYAPLGDSTTTLYAGLACSPCFSAQNHRKSVCLNNRCLQEISVNDVFDAVTQVLRTSHAEGPA